MKAKYGIISIGCFIAYPLSMFFFGFLSWLLRCGDGLLWMALRTYVLCAIVGIIFGVVGAIKKESPKRYFIIGLLLNTLLGFLLVYSWIRSVVG